MASDGQNPIPQSIIETDDFATAQGLIERSNSWLESMDARRIYGAIKFDIRQDKSNRMAGKIATVRAHRRRGDLTTGR